jgi:hypothetical protein
MKNLHFLLVSVLLATFSLNAAADSWKDERGHGRGHKQGHREYKEEYWDGNCKVEREYKKNGHYKEERKCHKSPPSHNGSVVVHILTPQPVVVEPGITIHGTIKIPH